MYSAACVPPCGGQAFPCAPCMGRLLPVGSAVPVHVLAWSSALRGGPPAKAASSKPLRVVSGLWAKAGRWVCSEAAPRCFAGLTGGPARLDAPLAAPALQRAFENTRQRHCHMSLSLSLSISIYLSIYLSLSLSISLVIFLYLSISLFIYLSIHLYIDR